MKKQKLKITLEGTYSGDVVGGFTVTGICLQAFFIGRG
jgi:hypothetical protein